MNRWWINMALAVGCASWAVTQSSAQSYQPSPLGALRMPDPTPTAPSMSGEHVPDLIPGPITAAQAPPGPPSALSLPENHTSAFQANCFGPDCGCFCEIGILALERTHLGGPQVAGAGGYGSDAINPLALPPISVQPVYGTNDIHQPANLGMSGTIGYLWNGQEIELSVMGIFQNSRSLAITDPNQLYVPFTNAPQGFAGDNGLWMEADQVSTTFTSSLLSPELNYRYSSEALYDAQLIIGVRYLNLREKLDIKTIDDITLPQDQALVATYTSETRNSIIAPQIGIDYEHTFDHFQCLTFGFIGKAALGPNFAEITNALVRGDAYSGFNDNRSHVSLGGIYELNGYLDFNILQRMYIRAGYTALWVTGIDTAADQIDFNLATPSGQQSSKGTAFYYGPSLQLHFLF